MRNFNAFDSRTVFSLWMGTNAMSDARKESLLSIQATIGCPSLHLTLQSLPHWCHPEFPIHGSFQFLSAVHRADYMRCYLMHVYGGGYTDVKGTSVNWVPYFERLASSNSVGLGYTEIGPQGVARVGGQLQAQLMENWSKLIGMCAMIFKPQTEFTSEWYSQLHRTLDQKYDLLQKNPARHPQDYQGASFTDGTTSSYPFAWTELLGNILHPLILQRADQILHGEIAPSFSNYR
jgi:hypothetical protein